MNSHKTPACHSGIYSRNPAQHPPGAPNPSSLALPTRHEAGILKRFTNRSGQGDRPLRIAMQAYGSSVGVKDAAVHGDDLAFFCKPQTAFDDRFLVFNHTSREVSGGEQSVGGIGTIRIGF